MAAPRSQVELRPAPPSTAELSPASSACSQAVSLRLCGQHVGMRPSGLLASDSEANCRRVAAGPEGIGKRDHMGFPHPSPATQQLAWQRVLEFFDRTLKH